MTTTSKGFLGTIERIGNKLPDPVTLFLLGALLVLLLSQVGAGLGWTAVNPANGQEVVVKPLLSGEGLEWVWTSMVENFTGFAAGRRAGGDARDRRGGTDRTDRRDPPADHPLHAAGPRRSGAGLRRRHELRRDRCGLRRASAAGGRHLREHGAVPARRHRRGVRGRRRGIRREPRGHGARSAARRGDAAGRPAPRRRRGRSGHRELLLHDRVDVPRHRRRLAGDVADRRASVRSGRGPGARSRRATRPRPRNPRRPRGRPSSRPCSRSWRWGSGSCSWWSSTARRSPEPSSSGPGSRCRSGPRRWCRCSSCSSSFRASSSGW